MATNKHAIIRYKVLDNCFSRKFKQFFIEDLMKECSAVLSEHFGSYISISRRQIYDDIKFMKSEAGYSAPIESIRNGKRVFYKYSDPEFSIENSQLNLGELEQLKNVLEIFRRVKGLEKFQWLGELETKLDDSLGDKASEIISFEENEDLKGIGFLNPLYNYIKNKTVLKITYKSFRMESPVEIVFHPYYLKQYNNRWFLLGLNDSYRNLQNLALDRIENLEINSSGYIENTVNFEDYFYEIIGVSNDEEAEVKEIKIELTENIIPYIRSKPFHGTQKLKGNILTLELKLNYELESLILSFGENMKVLEPTELRIKLKERLKKADSLYDTE